MSSTQANEAEPSEYSTQGAPTVIEPNPRRSARKIASGHPTPTNLPPLPSKSKKRLPSPAVQARETLRKATLSQSRAHKERIQSTSSNQGTSRAISPTPPPVESYEELPLASESEEEYPLSRVKYSPDVSVKLEEEVIENIMANNNGNNGGQRAPAFRVPFAWDKNAPSFDTEDADDLMTFVDHIGQIFGLANVTNDQEKKRRLTDYLSVKKKEIWRSLASYKRGTYERFLEDVYKIYPEVKSSKIGSLDALVKLCKSYKGIEMTEEGTLKRFGAEFYSLVKKLMKGKAAITTNSEACRRYLDTLETSFAAALRMMVSSKIF